MARIVSTNSVRSERFAYLEKVCPAGAGGFAARVLEDYGAMFVASPSVAKPYRCIFRTPEEVNTFHKTLTTRQANIGGSVIELQEEAMRSLLNAVAEASAMGLRITPLDGPVAGRRDYADTVRIWNSRFLPGLNHWVRSGKISRAEAENAKTLPVHAQVEKVLYWESKGFFFATDRTRSIFYSVAPPGSSQHLSLIAFDVAQYSNQRVREIMNKHGWYQTVKTDKPHFTFLGIEKKDLPSHGLRAFRDGSYEFWLLDLSGRRQNSTARPPILR